MSYAHFFLFLVMDLLVEVAQVDLKTANDRYTLRCKVETKHEELTRSAVVNFPAGSADRPPESSWPRFRFRLKREVEEEQEEEQSDDDADGPLELALTFTLEEPLSERSSALELQEEGEGSGTAALGDLRPVVHEIGRSIAHIRRTDLAAAPEWLRRMAAVRAHHHHLHQQHPGDNPQGLGTRLPQVSIISSKVPGTADVEKFMGKIWFTCTWSSCSDSHSSINSSNAPESQAISRGTTPIRISTEMSRDVFPSCTNTLSVMFHSVNNLTSPHTQLNPVAYLGRETKNLRLSSILEGGTGEHSSSMLRYLRLRCNLQGRSSLMSTGVLLQITEEGNHEFFASHSLRGFPHFIQIHSEYNLQWLRGEGSAFKSFNPISGRIEPNVLISFTHFPPKSQYAEFSGLELLVKSVELLANPQQNHKVVLCVHLSNKDSKGRAIQLGKSKPPFIQENRKTKVGNDTKDNISIALIDGHTFDMAYFFLNSKSDIAVPGKNNFSLELRAYVVDPLSVLPWWEASWESMAILDLPQGLQKLLELPKHQKGVVWEVNDFAVPGGIRSIKAVLRWKSRTLQFMSPEVFKDISSLPDVERLCCYSSRSDTPPTQFTSGLNAAQTQPIPRDPPIISGGEVDVRRIHEDNLRLKKENASLRQRIEMLSAELEEVRYNHAKTCGRIDLEMSSREALIHKTLELERALVAETNAKRLYKHRTHELQNALIGKNDIEAAYIHLEETHAVQQKLVQELQSKVEKYRKCSKVCKQQERVINQLEVILTEQARAQGFSGSNAMSHMSKENVRLRATLQQHMQKEMEDHQCKRELRVKEETICTLKEQLSEAREECRQLSMRHPKSPEAGHGGRRRLRFSETPKQIPGPSQEFSL